jgi:hypothetical protein
MKRQRVKKQVVDDSDDENDGDIFVEEDEYDFTDSEESDLDLQKSSSNGDDLLMDDDSDKKPKRSRKRRIIQDHSIMTKEEDELILDEEEMDSTQKRDRWSDPEARRMARQNQFNYTVDGYDIDK